MKYLKGSWNFLWKIYLVRDLKDSLFYVPCSFLSYWIECNHLPLLTALLLHINVVPQDTDQ